MTTMPHPPDVATPRAPSTPRLFRMLREAGATLRADGDRLVFNGPRGSMSDALRAALRRRKPELLAAIAGDYVRAAHALLLADVPERQRWDLAVWFDAEVAERVGRGMGRGEATRAAYRDLAYGLEGGAS